MEKNKGKIIGEIKNSKGITLLALAVTIVVLLILTSIGIKLALGNNGIIGETKNAKEQAEIDEEKGIVKRATTVSLIKSKGSRVEQDTLEKALNDETGEGKTEVSDAGDVFEILFTDSDRYYEVDSEGNISDANKIAKDEYAGDITKGGRCDGSEEKPYEISCIEDLVAFSNMSNGTGIRLENGKTIEITRGDWFRDKYVILTKTLNFKSRYSYTNYMRTDFGNLNNNDDDGNELITEMTTGTGFISMFSSNYNFQGKFDGKGNSILNIYINPLEENTATQGLFSGLDLDSEVKNLTITGNIKSNGMACGIGGGHGYDKNIKIVNCVNKADITGYTAVGGITSCYVNVENCKNYGKITLIKSYYSYGGAGGIVGIASHSSSGIYNISYCENYGEVNGNSNCGGIVGNSIGKLNIINCENKGNIEATANSGGILGGQENGHGNILNSYNEGEVHGIGNSGGIIGNLAIWGQEMNVNINNCYNIGAVKSNKIAGGILGVQSKNNLSINNSYNAGNIGGTKEGEILGQIVTATDTETKTEFSNVYCVNTAIGTGELTSGEATLKSVSEIKSQSFVNLLNSNIGTNADWEKWKLGEAGYPTFEE